MKNISLKKLVKIVLLVGICISSITIFSCKCINTQHNKPANDDRCVIDSVLYDNAVDSITYKYELEFERRSDSLQTILIPLVDKYIDSVAPNNKINCKLLVNLCFKHSIDLLFVIAHAQVESNFGTCGRSIKNNSIFNICNDKYKDINDSIEPYLILLKRDYLTTSDGYVMAAENLFVSFTNKRGQRYESNLNYEKILKARYETLYTMFDVYILELNHMHDVLNCLDD